MEPVNLQGVPKLEDQRTVSLKLFIADRHHAWEIDAAQATEWNDLIMFVRVSVENVRREIIGAPLLNTDGSIPSEIPI